MLAYGGRRLWLKSDDLLRPVVVLRGADAAALVRPSLRARLDALRGGARAPLETRPRLVALTFDDGPYPVVTPLLLQTLRDLRVPATFFLIGRDAEQFPDLARAIAAGGHEMADHTLTHPGPRPAPRRGGRRRAARRGREPRADRARPGRAAAVPAAARAVHRGHTARRAVGGLRHDPVERRSRRLARGAGGCAARPRAGARDGARDRPAAQRAAGDGRRPCPRRRRVPARRATRSSRSGALLRRSSADQLNRPAKVVLGGA